MPPLSRKYSLNRIGRLLHMPSDTTNDDIAKPCEEANESQLLPAIASAWEATANTLSDAASAISEAGSAAAAKAMDFGANAAKEIAEKTTAVLSATGVSSAVEYLDDTLEERGIKDAFSDAAEAVGDKLDQVTGKQLVELLEAKLRRQDEYNDILATRLSEALQRIAALETKAGR